MKTQLWTTALFFAIVSQVNAATFYYNQVAYDSAAAKTAIIESSAALGGTAFSLLSNGSAVFSGTLDAGSVPDNWTTNKYYVADFSAFKTPGVYTLQVTENGSAVTSKSITIAGKALAANTLVTVLSYFRADRADDASVWNEDAAISYYGGRSGTHDVRGGWYDASGDESKYFSHLSYADYLNPQQIPLTTWALAFTYDRIPAELKTLNMDTFTQAEALWGADFLLRMQDPDGYFYMTVFDGWGYQTRQICAFSTSDGTKSANYQTAYREGGGMAIAALARVSTWGIGGDSSSAAYLAAAERGFTHLESKQTIGGTCAYCDDGAENIIDDYTALLAASELYNATKETTYLAAARKRAQHLAGRLNAAGYFNSDDAGTRPFWHASDAGLPLIALGRYLEVEPEAAQATAAKTAMAAHLSWLLQITDKVVNPFGYARQTYKTGSSVKDGFFIPHDNESGYWWQGENARLASLSTASVYAARLLYSTVPDSVERYAENQLDWILGKNPFGYCFMYGKGTKNPGRYSGSSSNATTLTGGIANGITGSDTDGSGIAWDAASALGLNTWDNWRWIEQWLPHSTWYLMALAALNDEVQTPAAGIPCKPVRSTQAFSIALHGHTLNITFPGTARPAVRIIDPRGRILLSQKADASLVSMELPAGYKGLFLIQAEGYGAQKFILN